MCAGCQEERHREHHPHRDRTQAQAGRDEVRAARRPHGLPEGGHERLQERGQRDLGGRQTAGHRNPVRPQKVGGGTG